MEEIFKSEVTGREYKASEAIRIIDPKQVAFYLSKGVPLYDIYNSKGVLVCVFKKADTKEAMTLWRNKTINTN